ncbi:MAG: hypothetical protein AAF126_12920 [Chloroflexota bacterium]
MVKLDWDIEAEQGKQKQYAEDPLERRARYQGVLRLLLAVGVLAGIIAGVAYLIEQRWEQVNQRVEQILIDTVQAEVATLRVGDREGFLDLQRSATEEWGNQQLETFNAYQTLKTTSDVVLSGRVIDTTIDGQRGRVSVEEIIDGVPYVQTWFYWRYDEGWAHVPPDYEFWGTEASIETDRVTVRYKTVDEAVANDISVAVETWLSDSCSYLDCSTLPPITVDIITASNSPVRWADNEQNAWQLVVPSPYTGRARADMPFDQTLQTTTATLLANRIVAWQTDNIAQTLGGDASYLLQTTTQWMIARFLQVNAQTHLIDSLVANYGIEVIPSLLRNIQSTSSLSILPTVAGATSLPEMPLDWRDFALWRLELEDDLIEQGDETTWTTLYDFSDESVRNAAYQRYVNAFIGSNRTVLQANVSLDSSTPQLIARVNVTRGFDTGEEIVVFNLINGSWRRAN